MFNKTLHAISLISQIPPKGGFDLQTYPTWTRLNEHRLESVPIRDASGARSDIIRLVVIPQGQFFWWLDLIWKEVPTESRNTTGGSPLPPGTIEDSSLPLHTMPHGSVSLGRKVQIHGTWCSSARINHPQPWIGIWIYPLLNIQKPMENHHVQLVNLL
jgi:hypothetical protein